MKSPYRYAIVYDIETGGFTSGIHPLMEVAACVVDMNSLSIIDRWEALVAFRMDLAFTASITTKKLATDIFKQNAKSTDGVKSVNFKGKAYDKATFHEELETEIDRFIYFVDSVIGQRMITSKELGKIAKSEFLDHFTLFKNLCYTQGALAVNKIPLKTIIKDGLPYEEVYSGLKELIKKYTIGSNKPILSGHNISEFDNPYIEALFTAHKDDLWKNVSKFEMDTLKWVKLRWPEADAYNLGAACHKLGITIDDAHRAMSDTEANAKLLIKILESLRGYGSEEKQYTRKKINLQY